MDAFSALADPNRRAIVELLAQRGELTAGEIAQQFPISAPAVSQHLKVLREANVLLMEKRAQQRIYRINPDAMRAVESWAHRMAQVWRRRFDALDELLQEEQRKLQRADSRASVEGSTGEQVEVAEEEE